MFESFRSLTVNLVSLAIGFILSGRINIYQQSVRLSCADFPRGRFSSANTDSLFKINIKRFVEDVVLIPAHNIKACTLDQRCIFSRVYGASAAFRTLT